MAKKESQEVSNDLVTPAKNSPSTAKAPKVDPHYQRVTGVIAYVMPSLPADGVEGVVVGSPAAAGKIQCERPAVFREPFGCECDEEHIVSPWQIAPRPGLTERICLCVILHCRP